MDIPSVKRLQSHGESPLLIGISIKCQCNWAIFHSYVCYVPLILDTHWIERFQPCGNSLLNHGFNSKEVFDIRGMGLHRSIINHNPQYHPVLCLVIKQLNLWETSMYAHIIHSKFTFHGMTYPMISLYSVFMGASYHHISFIALTFSWFYNHI